LIELSGVQSIYGIGIGCGGPLDRETGVILSSPNLPGWRDVPLRQIIQDALGAPVTLDNDANAAALAEARFGAGRQIQNFIYLTISTGIGGAIVINGQLYHGSTGNAGEFGHQTLNPNGPLCLCGKRGCLEAYASGTSIARCAREAAQSQQTLITQFVDGDLDRINADIVSFAARKGDQVALELWEQAGCHLGHGIANAINIINPERVILGGGVTKAGDLLFVPTRRYAAKWTMPELFRNVEIVPAELGDDIGIYGAAVLAMERLT
jgi:glucokinase